jgi:septal ring factor EnvC (AmiA/AmiB activator)
MTDWQGLLSAGAGALGGFAATGGAWLESRRRKRNQDLAQARAEQNAALDERSDILKQINEQLLGPLKDELKDVRDRLKVAEDKIDGLEDTNNRLVAFIYKLIGLARLHGFDKDILPADVPPGIHL